jgi:hypothetical protein
MYSIAIGSHAQAIGVNSICIGNNSGFYSWEGLPKTPEQFEIILNTEQFVIYSIGTNIKLIKVSELNSMINYFQIEKSIKNDDMIIRLIKQIKHLTISKEKYKILYNMLTPTYKKLAWENEKDKVIMIVFKWKYDH